MTKEERLTSITLYLAKVVDHLQGREDQGNALPILRRMNSVLVEQTAQNSPESAGGAPNYVFGPTVERAE